MTRRKLSALLCLALSLLLLAAGCKKQEPLPAIELEPVQTYTHKHGYAFQYPAGFQAGSGGANMDVLLYDPSDTGYLANFSVTCVEGEIDLTGMTGEMLLTDLPWADAVVTQFEHGAFLDAYAVRATVEAPNRDKTVQVRQIIFNHGGYHFVLTFSAMTAQLERAQPAFDLIQRSFAFTQ